jgi:hypothetical protein
MIIPGAPRDAFHGAVFKGGGDTVTNAPSQYVTDQHQQNIGFGNAIAAQPYQNYTGPRIAPFTPTQQAAQTQLTNTGNTPANFTQNGFGGGIAQNVANNAAGFNYLQNGFGHGVASDVSKYQVGQLKDTDLASYMNPFTQSVIDRTADQINRNNQIALRGVGSQALSQGAYGGSRQGIAQAETYSGYADTLASTTAGLNLQNFSQAQQAALNDINLGLRGQQLKLAAANQMMNSAQARNNAFTQQQQLQLGAANQLQNSSNSRNNALLNQQQYDTNRGTILGGAGQQQQNMNQANLDLAYQDFLRQQNYPREQLNLRQSILSGAPVGSTQTTPSASTAQQLLGLGLGGASLYNSITGNNLSSLWGSLGSSSMPNSIYDTGAQSVGDLASWVAGW